MKQNNNKTLDGLGKIKRTYFKAAEAMADLSDYAFPIGCVLVNRHRIISSGYNSKNNCHGFQARLDKQFFNLESKGCKHAEIDALLPFLKRKRNLSQATLYIFRKNKLGQVLLGRPCPRCMSVIKTLGIRKLEYTTVDGYAGEVLNYDD